MVCTQELPAGRWDRWATPAGGRGGGEGLIGYPEQIQSAVLPKSEEIQGRRMCCLVAWK